MIVAAAKVMRCNGLDPTNCSWMLNDVDPLAVALAGVNCVAHGLGLNVVLGQGNGLLLATGLPGDPLASDGLPCTFRPTVNGRPIVPPCGVLGRLDPASARAQLPFADGDRETA